LFVKGKVLAQVNKQGYMAVAIGHPVKPMRTNILVAMAWIGPRQDGIHVNHINGIKSDNRACNLEYATCSENHLHAFRTGLRKAKQGEQCWTAKLDESKVRAARSEVGMSPRQLAEKYGISVGAMRQVLDRKTWKHVTA
jgi:DNA-binding transcriptional regulator YiaG